MKSNRNESTPGQQHPCSGGALFMYHSESGASAPGPQGNQLASSAAETVARVIPEDKLPEPKVQSSAILLRHPVTD